MPPALDGQERSRCGSKVGWKVAAELVQGFEGTLLHTPEGDAGDTGAGASSTSSTSNAP